MGKIKNIVFDLGGVIIDLDRDEPVRRLIEIGVKDADGLIDPYEQKGVFQDLETGKIGVEEFCAIYGSIRVKTFLMRIFVGLGLASLAAFPNINWTTY